MVEGEREGEGEEGDGEGDGEEGEEMEWRPGSSPRSGCLWPSFLTS